MFAIPVSHMQIEDEILHPVPLPPAGHSAILAPRVCPEKGYDIMDVQKLLGQQDVRTTMIDTLVVNRGPTGACSLMDVT